ncbi:MAG: hypothetical protein COB29_15835, partial [Sulfitobacter sp.]
MSSKETNPADGERRAIRAYGAQYRVAAKLIYDALLNGTLEWIKIADPEAGRVDDIQIATHGKLDAYQVKWNDFAKAVTYNEIISDTTDGNPNLIAQLADGWCRLKELHNDRNVYVHLTTNDYRSTNTAKIPVGKKVPSPKHFAAFLRFAWENFRKGGDVPEEWLPAIEGFQKASELTKKEFKNFAAYCHLNFTYSDPRDEIVQHKSEGRRKEDIETLASLLFREVGSAERTIELSKDQIIERLNWNKRFETINEHQFHVDEFCYRPNKSSIGAIEQAITSFDSGYIAMIGTPGSGKSTTLTQHFRYQKNIRVIKYYAFTPSGINSGRGEAYNFLHDLHLEIRNHGFSGKGKNFPQTREDLLEVFKQQIGELHKDWEDNGTKTLLLIDGLDHIEREQSPERTLLKDLPLPNDVPNGVLIILGSQKIELDGMIPGIKMQIEKEPNRLLRMEPLDREAVYGIIGAYRLPVTPSSDIKDRILSLSAGHPLALSYLLNKLRDAKNKEQLSSAIEHENPYGNHIEETYEQYWIEVERNENLMDALGLISRLRCDVDLKLLVSWTKDEVVKSLIKNVGHFFIHKSKTQWSFFHNSFRQFLLQKTGFDIFGDIDEEKNKKYHERLAGYASLEEPANSWAWEGLYHFSIAGDDETVLKIASQDYFRNQFLNFRPISRILEDTTLAFQSAKNCFDGIAMTRLLLIEKELNDRNESLQQSNLEELIWETKGVDAVKNYTLNGTEILVSKERGLELVNHMINKGYAGDALEIFNLCEPLDFLRGSTRLGNPAENSDNILNLWVETAHYYRPLNKIVESISRIEVSSEHWYKDEDPATLSQRYQRKLYTRLSDALVDRGDTCLLDDFCDYLRNKNEHRLLRRIDFQLYYRNQSTKHAIKSFEKILSWVDITSDDVLLKLLIAEGFIKHFDDYEEAEKWVKEIKQPLPYKENASEAFAGLSPFESRIRLCRILATFNNPPDPILLVPIPENESDFGAVFFERMLVQISNVWGNALGRAEHKHFSIQQLKPAITFFNKSHHQTKDWYSWYKYVGASTEYFNFLIGAVHAHGKKALSSLKEEFEKQWSTESAKQYWGSTRKRNIALKIYDIERDKEWLVRHLDKIENEFDIYNDLSSQISEYYEQATAWIKIGDIGRAENLIRNIFDCSFGINYEKDDQICKWVIWLSNSLDHGVSGLEEVASHFASTLAVLQNSDRGSYCEDAISDFVSLVTRNYPDQSFSTVQWLFEEEASEYCSAVIGLITGTLQRSTETLDTALTVAKHLLIPFQKRDDEEFAKFIVGEIIQENDDQIVRHNLTDLIICLKTKAYQNSRETWFKAIRDLTISERERFNWLEGQIGKARPRSGGATGQLITLKDGTILNHSQVQERVYDFTSFVNLFENIKKDDYYPWERLLPSFLSDLSHSELVETHKKIEQNNPRAKAMALLIKRYHELGDFDTAEKMTAQIVANSSPNGWVRSYDGGSRSIAYKCQIELGIPDIRKKALEHFIDDYISEHRWPRELIRGFDELLPIFFETMPYEEIWHEIQFHIEHLYDFKYAKKRPAFIYTSAVSEDDCSSLINFLFYSLTLPIRSLATEAFQAICTIHAGNTHCKLIGDNIAEFLSSGDQNKQLSALAILQKIGFDNAESINRHTNAIKLLTASDSLMVRLVAIDMANNHSISCQTIDP